MTDKYLDSIFVGLSLKLKYKRMITRWSLPCKATYNETLISAPTVTIILRERLINVARPTLSIAFCNQNLWDLDIKKRKGYVIIYGIGT